MSSGSNEAIDLLNLPAGTTVAEFQRRLLETQNAARDQHLEDRFNEDDDKDLRKKIALLEQQVEQMESNVSNLQKKIHTRKEKRQKEAGITNLTPEERAQFVIDEEEEGYGDVPDLDVIFEYMLLVGSSATDNTNDLSQADFLGADNKLREEAMSDPKVLQQSEYTYLKFTKAKNILETRQDGLGNICLILEWKMVIENDNRLEANVRDHVRPQLSMEAIIKKQLVTYTLQKKLVAF
ncbi:hypothetical protein BY458DRAFT_435354 [Sporodiniella umbellata]|nr:hypothetical protein BY458DRAFT_435354 [Sporodiniella umbellata]